jgi:hypothetical protein
MKKILVVMLIIGAFIAGYFFSQKYNFKLEPKEEANINISPTAQPLVGNDVDSHGCKGSAGYGWCEVLQKCLRPWEEKCEIVSPTAMTENDESLKTIIKQLLVAEHGNTANELTITISKHIGDYASGGASSQGGGGMWLAAKVNGGWKLVFDGNGTVDCQMIKTNYQFPAEMLTNFCD